MHIFNVTTIKNLESIALSVKRHADLHGYEKYTIICPSKDICDFKSRLGSIPKIEIVSEDTILPFWEFTKISNISSRLFERSDVNPKRLNWYYQQVLKITYAIQCQADFLLMWDADSIPLDCIKFFHEDKSLSYGSLIEYHNEYFDTIKDIFEFNLPKMAFTIQFFTLTSIERDNLVNKLNKYKEQKDGESTAQWVANILMSSVARKNVNLERLNQSYFSEQELVGLANIELNKSSQKGIKHFRPGRFWKMNKFRIFILKIFGYKYITMERNIIPSSRSADFFYFWIFLFYDTFRYSCRNK